MYITIITQQGFLFHTTQIWCLKQNYQLPHPPLNSGQYEQGSSQEKNKRGGGGGFEIKAFFMTISSVGTSCSVQQGLVIPGKDNKVEGRCGSSLGVDIYTSPFPDYSYSSIEQKFNMEYTICTSSVTRCKCIQRIF